MVGVQPSAAYIACCGWQVMILYIFLSFSSGNTNSGNSLLLELIVLKSRANVFLLKLKRLGLLTHLGRLFYPACSSTVVVIIFMLLLYYNYTDCNVCVVFL